MDKLKLTFADLTSTITTRRNRQQPRSLNDLLTNTKRKLFNTESESSIRRKNMTALDHHPLWSSVQNHSPLLSLLPREVRNMIWKDVMGGGDGGMIIHLWLDGKKLRGAYCCWDGAGVGGEDCRLRCRDWMQEKEKNGKGTVKWPPALGVYGLLLACTQTYTESINYLFSLNTFNTRSPDVVNQLPRQFPPSHSLLLNAIHTFTFHWTLPPNQPPPSLSTASRKYCLEGKFDEAVKGCDRFQREWIRTWKSLSEMKGLKDLRVELITDTTTTITTLGGGSSSSAGEWVEGTDLEIVGIVKIPESVVVEIVEDRSARTLRDLVC